MFESYQYEKSYCAEGAIFCPHSFKYIVCNDLHNVNYKGCSLRPSYLKVKNSIICQIIMKLLKSEVNKKQYKVGQYKIIYYKQKLLTKLEIIQISIHQCISAKTPRS